jgi:hypothetical protein
MLIYNKEHMNITCMLYSRWGGGGGAGGGSNKLSQHTVSKEELLLPQWDDSLAGTMI